MTDIVIYTTPEKLLHKQDKLEDDDDKSEDGFYYWQLYNKPKGLKEGDKIYFATKGFVRGYFIVESIDKWNDIRFESKTWKDIEPIPTNHFQGFKYKWWES